MWKKHKVIMLPTTKSSKIAIIQGDKLWFYKDYINSNTAKNQHLYIISDEEIKEGDWVCVKNKVVKAENLTSSIGYYEGPAFLYFLEKDKKIIATTDDLKIDVDYVYGSGMPEEIDIFLPKPYDSFVKKYCELGGIDEVVVEYNQEMNSDGPLSWYEEVLKVTSDNIITIKNIKDDWNKDEMIYLLDDLRKQVNKKKMDTLEFKQWLEDNLY